MASPGQITRSILCLMVNSKDESLEDFRRRHIHSPGREVPLHVTLAYKFLLPEQLNHQNCEKLEQVASRTLAFSLSGKPLSSFPTSKVLYLTPSPASPVEVLLDALDVAFPELSLAACGYPVFHLTLALGYSEEERDQIIAAYFSCFGKEPLALGADRLAVYIERDGAWSEHLSYALGRPERL